MTNLPDSLILGALDGATSQKPIAFGQLLGAIQGTLDACLPEQDLRAALTGLLGRRLIATCHIIRGDTAQDVYWPTGIVRPALAPSPRTTPAHTAKPVRPRPTHQPKTEEPMPKSKPTTPRTASKTARAGELIKERGCIPQAELAQAVGTNEKSLYGLLAKACKAGEVVRLQVDGVPQLASKAFVEEARGSEGTEAEQSGQAAAPQAPAPNPIPAFLLRNQAKGEPDADGQAAKAGFLDYAIRANGELHITLDDGSLIFLPPGQTTRLGRFLIGTQGVWGSAS